MQPELERFALRSHKAVARELGISQGQVWKIETDVLRKFVQANGHVRTSDDSLSAAMMRYRTWAANLKQAAALLAEENVTHGEACELRAAIEEFERALRAVWVE